MLFVLAYVTNVATQKPLAEANQASITAGAFANNHLRNAEVIEAMGMLPGLRDRWFGQHRRVLCFANLGVRPGRSHQYSHAFRAYFVAVVNTWRRCAAGNRRQHHRRDDDRLFDFDG